MAEMKNGEEFHYFEDDEISLLDLLLVLARQKKIIMGITTLFVVVAIIASLLMTKVYQASTRILNPVQRPSFASLMEEKAGLMGDLLSFGPTGDNVYVSMLKSRSLQDQLLDRFVSNGWRDMVGAGKEMRRHDFVAENIGEMSVTEEKNGTILVTVSYTDQYKVADIANAYVEELQHMADHFFSTEAAQRRGYYENELDHAREALAQAEKSLREFQEKTGVYMGDAQLTANIQNRVNMRAQIAAREIQLRSLLSYATHQNPKVVKLEKEINGLKEEIARLELVTDSGDPLNPVGGMPAARFEYLEKFRDWKFQEVLYNTLLKMYETSRLDEAYTPVTIQVLDKAVTPEQRIKPKRKMMVVLAAMLGLFVSIFCAFLAEAWSRAEKDPEQKKKLKEFKEALGVHWLQRVLKGLVPSRSSR